MSEYAHYTVTLYLYLYRYLQEMLWPILFIIILALIRYMAQVVTVDGSAVDQFPQESIYPAKPMEHGQILVVPSNATAFVQGVSLIFLAFRVQTRIKIMMA